MHMYLGSPFETSGVGGGVQRLLLRRNPPGTANAKKGHISSIFSLDTPPRPNISRNTPLARLRRCTASAALASSRVSVGRGAHHIPGKRAHQGWGDH